MKKQAYWVIVPAAGVGSRMQADCPKQYLSINGKPMIAHSVDKLSALPQVERVVVALHPKDHWWLTLNLADPKKILTVIGGKARVDSVLLSLTFLEDYAKDNDWVLVHDAARPCVEAKDIQRLIQELDGHPVGGLLGLPVVDTLKQVDQNDHIHQTVSREGLWRAQTPQLFRYGLLRSSIEKALTDKQTITDEASAVEYAGFQPKMVLGNQKNIKVTMPADLDLAEVFI